jgi:hypothetical protein
MPNADAAALSSRRRFLLHLASGWTPDLSDSSPQTMNAPIVTPQGRIAVAFQPGDTCKVKHQPLSPTMTVIAIGEAQMQGIVYVGWFADNGAWNAIQIQAAALVKCDPPTVQ